MGDTMNGIVLKPTMTGTNLIGTGPRCVCDGNLLPRRNVVKATVLLMR